MAPTNCHAVFYSSTNCVIINWDADVVATVYYELQRETYGAGDWTVLDEFIDPGTFTYTDCDIENLAKYRYRVRSHYSVEFVDNEDPLWSVDEDDSWAVTISTWCTTNSVYCVFRQTWVNISLEASYSIVIRDTSSNQLALLDDYDSLEYTRVLNNAGFSQLVANTESIDPDYFGTDVLTEIWRAAPGVPWREDFTSMQRVSRFNFDGDDKEWMRLVGPGLENLLKRRIVLPNSGSAFLTLSGPQSDVMRELVRTQATNPEAVERVIAWLTVEADDGSGIELPPLNYRYESLFEKLAELAEVDDGVDFAVIHPETDVFRFEVYYPIRGLDRRVGNTDGNSPMIFSVEFGNMEEPSVEVNRAEEITIVYVAGDGVGADREIVRRSNLVGAENDTPWNWIEGFLEARQETSLAALAAFGDGYLAESKSVVTFTCTAVPTPSSLYGVHWDLGDMVTGWYRGVEYDMQVTEVRVTVTENGEDVQPIFNVVDWRSSGGYGYFV